MDNTQRSKVRYLMQEKGFSHRDEPAGKDGVISGFASAWENLTKSVGPIPPGVDMLGPYVSGRYGQKPSPLFSSDQKKVISDDDIKASQKLSLSNLKTFKDFEIYSRVNLGVTIKPEKLEQMSKAFDEGRYSAKDFGAFVAASMRKELTMNKAVNNDKSRGMDI